MGNKLSCCWCPKGRPKRCHRAGSADPPESEYETEVYEVAARDTVEPVLSPAALEHAQVDVRASERNLVQQHMSDAEMLRDEEMIKNEHEWPTKLPLKYEYSSCATLFVGDSTITKPNLEVIVECVALVIDHLIKHRHGNRTLDIFDERLHPLTREKLPEECFKNDPEPEFISRFVGAIFTATQLRAGCGLITLIYLERLLSYAEIDICPINWKRIVLGAILESSIWDSPAVWDADDCEILRGITLENINEIERHFRKLLKFNIEVPRSVYTKCYFDLYTFAYDDDVILTFEPLTKERAQKLEAIGGLCDSDDYVEVCTAAMKRSVSADNIIIFQRSNAIIS